MLDDWLPDGNGIELCRDLLSCMPDLRCVIMTSRTSGETMLEAILAGGSGYVVKDIRGMPLASAIKDVGAGRSLLDNRAVAALITKLQQVIENGDGFSGFHRPGANAIGLAQRGPDQQANRRPDVPDRRSCASNYVSRLLAKLGVARPTQPASSTTQLKRPTTRYG